MAKTEIYENGDFLSLACTDPAVPVAGDPVIIGQLAGVCQVSEDAAGNASIACRGVFNVSVKGIDGGGNSAVAIGDRIYYVSGDTPKLSKKATGVVWGTALGTVTSGSTATIPVRVGY